MYGEDFYEAVQDDAGGEAIVVPAEFRACYPAISMALCGLEPDKGKGLKGIPPATFIIFARDGGIGFIIAPKDAAKNAHGFVSAPGELLSQIEHEIVEGRLGWKTPRSKRR